MIAKRHLVTAILGTFCLTTLLFMVVPTRSQTDPEYDPWKDVNDDGKIDILDITSLTSIYGAEGTPINQTELLLQLLTKIEQLNETVTGLQSKTSELEVNLAVLNSTKLGKPDYDSRWVAIAKGTELELQHGLNTTELLVYFIGRNPSGINHIHYGGYGSGGQWMGAHWNRLAAESIWVYRFPDDSSYAEVRVIIWKIPMP